MSGMKIAFFLPNIGALSPYCLTAHIVINVHVIYIIMYKISKIHFITDIIEKVQTPIDGVYFRPMMDQTHLASAITDNHSKEDGSAMMDFITQCWADNPQDRPTFHKVIKMLRYIKGNM